jgi:hypothetical protein
MMKHNQLLMILIHIAASDRPMNTSWSVVSALALIGDVETTRLVLPPGIDSARVSFFVVDLTITPTHQSVNRPPTYIAAMMKMTWNQEY